MSDWMVGVIKAATDRGPGLDDAALNALEAGFGEPLPPALRQLYAQMNGASFAPDVRLRVAGTSEDNLLAASRGAVGAWPAGVVWQFGTRGDIEPLFAGRSAKLRPLIGDRAPAWIASLPDDAWIFGVGSDEGGYSLFRSLEGLLWKLIPPVETEDFGENTFVRALNAVESAIDALKQAAPAVARTVKKAVKKKLSPTKKAPAKPAKKAPAKPAKKAPSRRVPAKKTKPASKAKSSRRASTKRKPRR